MHRKISFCQYILYKNNFLSTIPLHYFIIKVESQQVLYPASMTEEIMKSVFPAQITQAISNAQRRLKTSALLKNLLQSQKNSIFLFAIDESVGKMLPSIGEWLLGATIKRKKKFQYLAQNGGEILHQTIKISEKIDIQVIENKMTRVLGINFSRVPLSSQDFTRQDQKQKCKNIGELLFFLQLIWQQIQNNKIIYYGVINGIDEESKIQKQIKKMKGYLLNPSLRLIICQTQRDEDEPEPQQNDISKLHIFAQKYTTSPTNLDLFQSYEKRNMIGKYIESEFKLNQLKLKQIRKELTHCQRQILSPISNMITKILEGNEEQSRAAYKIQVENVKQLLNDMRVQVEQIVKEEEKDNEGLAMKSFVLEVLEIKTNYKEAEQKNQYIEKLKEFYKEIFNKLSLIINMLDINYLVNYSMLLLEQSSILQAISDQFVPSYINVINAIRAPPDVVYTIAKIITNIKIQEKKPRSYYDLLECIVKKSENNIKEGKHQEQDKLNASFQKINKQLPIIKTVALLYRENESAKNIFTVMKNFFIGYFAQKNQNKYTFEFLYKVFVGSATKLQDYGFPELAIELYKALKFTNKIQECIKQMIYKNNLAGDEKQKIYQHTASYFQEIGLVRKAYDYVQLAFENADPFSEISQFNKLLEMKKKLITNTEQSKENTLIEEIITNKIDRKLYFSYEISKEFQDKIKKIDTLVKQSKIQTSIQLTKSQVQEFAFAYP